MFNAIVEAQLIATFVLFTVAFVSVVFSNDNK
jgi:hypothetical protein